MLGKIDGNPVLDVSNHHGRGVEMKRALRQGILPQRSLYLESYAAELLPFGFSFIVGFAPAVLGWGDNCRRR